VLNFLQCTHFHVSVIGWSILLLFTLFMKYMWYKNKQFYNSRTVYLKKNMGKQWVV
jgi:choline-glycine betaine transporter